VLLGALVLALVAAAVAPDRAPAVALYWNPIYRAEVALVVLAIAYLLGVAGWMAFNGQAFRRIELPGGAVLERDASELDAAAEGFDEFQERLHDRIVELEQAVAHLNDRMDRAEGGSTGAGSRVP
jgi:hypothetical protein